MNLEENTSNWNGVSILVLKITLFLALAGHLSSSIHMPEFFEHLARGHWIVSNHSLPETYIWAKLNTASVVKWRDPNWLYEILLSVTETKFGEVGLIIFKISAVFLSISSLALFLSFLSGDAFFGSLLSIVVASGYYVSGDFSPNFLALTLGCLFLYCAAKERTQALLLFFLAYLFCNIDAALALILPFGLYLASNRRNFLVVLISLLLAFLSPPYWGLQIVEGMQTELTSLSWDVLLQRKAANIYDFRFAFLLLFWIVTGLLFSKIKLFDRILKVLLSLSALATLLGLASTNFLGLALVCSASLVAKLWSSYREDRNQELARALQLLQAKLSKLSPVGIIWVVVAICVITIKPRIEYPVSSALLPKLEVDAVLSRGLKLPIYHDSFVGSYLSYRFSMSGLAPSDSVLTTAQAQVYAAHFSSIDTSSARVEYLAQSLNPLFFAYFDFLAPKSVICRQSEPLYSVLIRDPKWKAVNVSRDGLSKGLFGWALFERNE